MADCLGSCCQLPVDFIRKYPDNMNWSIICRYQNLSKSFIKEFSEYLDWEMIDKYQTEDILDTPLDIPEQKDATQKIKKTKNTINSLEHLF